MTTKQLTLTEMKERNAHWFKQGECSSFGTKIETKPNKLNLFITSEWVDYEETKRGYTIRYFNANTNHVETICGYLEHSTLEEAKEALQGIMSTYDYFNSL
ncbi:hypothetical protein [Phage f2b1]|nr:hypothetical protein [Phage f2b1]